MTGESIGKGVGCVVFCVVLLGGACQVLAPAIDLGACAAKRALEGESVAQIAIDCRADVASVIEALLSSSDPRIRATAAHAEAARTKMLLSVPLNIDGG